MNTIDGTALFPTPDSVPGLFHDLREGHVVLQRWKFSPQARKQSKKNAFYPWVKGLAVAIEQPNRSQVLHDHPVIAVREAAG